MRGIDYISWSMKDNFSKQSAGYSKYRPDYPAELFQFITSYIKNKKLAWDCGTGNGQSAVQLANHFENVIATDTSSKQLEQAERKENIIYKVAAAEESGIETGTVNLVTVVQAIHWFQFDKFYAEVKRVTSADAHLAVWCYSLLRIEKDIDALIKDYHFNTLTDYWDAERKYVDDGYADIPFPFDKIATPNFEIIKYWALEDLRGYLETWSACQKYLSVNNSNPVLSLMDAMRPFWETGEKKKIIFPIHLLLGAIK